MLHSPPSSNHGHSSSSPFITTKFKSTRRTSNTKTRNNTKNNNLNNIVNNNNKARVVPPLPPPSAPKIVLTQASSPTPTPTLQEEDEDEDGDNEKDDEWIEDEDGYGYGQGGEIEEEEEEEASQQRFNKKRRKPNNNKNSGYHPHHQQQQLQLPPTPPASQSPPTGDDGSKERRRRRIKSESRTWRNSEEEEEEEIIIISSASARAKATSATTVGGRRKPTTTAPTATAGIAAGTRSSSTTIASGNLKSRTTTGGGIRTTRTTTTTGSNSRNPTTITTTTGMGTRTRTRATASKLTSSSKPTASTSKTIPTSKPEPKGKAPKKRNSTTTADPGLRDYLPFSKRKGKERGGEDSEGEEEESDDEEEEVLEGEEEESEVEVGRGGDGRKGKEKGKGRMEIDDDEEEVEEIQDLTLLGPNPPSKPKPKSNSNSTVASKPNPKVNPKAKVSSSKTTTTTSSTAKTKTTRGGKSAAAINSSSNNKSSQSQFQSGPSRARTAIARARATRGAAAGKKYKGKGKKTEEEEEDEEVTVISEDEEEGEGELEERANEDNEGEQPVRKNSKGKAKGKGGGKGNGKNQSESRRKTQARTNKGNAKGKGKTKAIEAREEEKGAEEETPDDEENGVAPEQEGGGVDILDHSMEHQEPPTIHITQVDSDSEIEGAARKETHHDDDDDDEDSSVKSTPQRSSTSNPNSESDSDAPKITIRPATAWARDLPVSEKSRSKANAKAEAVSRQPSKAPPSASRAPSVLSVGSTGTTRGRGRGKARGRGRRGGRSVSPARGAPPPPPHSMINFFEPGGSGLFPNPFLAIRTPPPPSVVSRDGNASLIGDDDDDGDGGGGGSMIIDSDEEDDPLLLRGPQGAGGRNRRAAPRASVGVEIAVGTEEAVGVGVGVMGDSDSDEGRSRKKGKGKKRTSETKGVQTDDLGYPFSNWGSFHSQTRPSLSMESSRSSFGAIGLGVGTFSSSKGRNIPQLSSQTQTQVGSSQQTLTQQTGSFMDQDPEDEPGFSQEMGGPNGDGYGYETGVPGDVPAMSFPPAPSAPPAAPPPASTSKSTLDRFNNVQNSNRHGSPSNRTRDPPFRSFIPPPAPPPPPVSLPREIVNRFHSPAQGQDQRQEQAFSSQKHPGIDEEFDNPPSPEFGAHQDADSSNGSSPPGSPRYPNGHRDSDEQPSNVSRSSPRQLASLGTPSHSPSPSPSPSLSVSPRLKQQTRNDDQVDIGDTTDEDGDEDDDGDGKVSKPSEAPTQTMRFLDDESNQQHLVRDLAEEEGGGEDLNDLENEEETDEENEEVMMLLSRDNSAIIGSARSFSVKQEEVEVSSSLSLLKKVPDSNVETSQPELPSGAAQQLSGSSVPRNSQDMSWSPAHNSRTANGDGSSHHRLSSQRSGGDRPMARFGSASIFANSSPGPSPGSDSSFQFQKGAIHSMSLNDGLNEEEDDQHNDQGQADNSPSMVIPNLNNERNPSPTRNLLLPPGTTPQARLRSLGFGVPVDSNRMMSTPSNLKLGAPNPLSTGRAMMARIREEVESPATDTSPKNTSQQSSAAVSSLPNKSSAPPLTHNHSTLPKRREIDAASPARRSPTPSTSKNVIAEPASGTSRRGATPIGTKDRNGKDKVKGAPQLNLRSKRGGPSQAPTSTPTKPSSQDAIMGSPTPSPRRSFRTASEKERTRSRLSRGLGSTGSNNGIEGTDVESPDKRRRKTPTPSPSPAPSSPEVERNRNARSPSRDPKFLPSSVSRKGKSPALRRRRSLAEELKDARARESRGDSDEDEDDETMGPKGSVTWSDNDENIERSEVPRVEVELQSDDEDNELDLDDEANGLFNPSYIDPSQSLATSTQSGPSPRLRLPSPPAAQSTSAANNLPIPPPSPSALSRRRSLPNRAAIRGRRTSLYPVGGLRPRSSVPDIPIVEISSMDPKAAAKAAAILKVHHRYVQEGWSRVGPGFEADVEREIARANDDQDAQEEEGEAFEEEEGGFEQAEDDEDLEELFKDAEIEETGKFTEFGGTSGKTGKKKTSKGKRASQRESNIHSPLTANFSKRSLETPPRAPVASTSAHHISDYSRTHSHSRRSVTKPVHRHSRSHADEPLVSSFDVDFNVWGKSEWRRLEACYVKERKRMRSENRDSEEPDADRVVARFLVSVGVDSDELQQEGDWCWETLRARSIAISVRHIEGRKSRASFIGTPITINSSVQAADPESSSRRRGLASSSPTGRSKSSSPSKSKSQRRNHWTQRVEEESEENDFYSEENDDRDGDGCGLDLDEGDGSFEDSLEIGPASAPWNKRPPPLMSKRFEHLYDDEPVIQPSTATSRQQEPKQKQLTRYPSLPQDNPISREATPTQGESPSPPDAPPPPPPAAPSTPTQRLFNYVGSFIPRRKNSPTPSSTSSDNDNKHRNRSPEMREVSHADARASIPGLAAAAAARRSLGIGTPVRRADLKGKSKSSSKRNPPPRTLPLEVQRQIRSHDGRLSGPLMYPVDHSGNDSSLMSDLSGVYANFSSGRLMAPLPVRNPNGDQSITSSRGQRRSSGGGKRVSDIINKLEEEEDEREKERKRVERLMKAKRKAEEHDLREVMGRVPDVNVDETRTLDIDEETSRLADEELSRSLEDQDQRKLKVDGGGKRRRLGKS